MRYTLMCFYTPNDLTNTNKIMNLSKVFVVALSAMTLVSCGDNVPANPKEGEIITINAADAAFEMVYVAPGAYTMGATPENEGIDTFTELPTHRVTLTKGFFIGTTEVTQGQWEAVMGNNPAQVKKFNEQENKELPVTDITWADAKLFVKKLSEMTGRKFRIPTEAEWEYAARGASKTFSRQYSGSQYADQVACFKQTSNGTPHPVGQFRPNEIGIRDMSGNVAEWVEDNFMNYKDSAQTDPCVVLSDTLSHVARGGSFEKKKNQCRVASRENLDADVKSVTIGLRIVMDK